MVRNPSHPVRKLTDLVYLWWEFGKNRLPRRRASPALPLDGLGETALLPPFERHLRI